MAGEEEGTFYVGDSDLMFLGMVAVLAARYQAKRKSGITRDMPGFAQSDRDAMRLLEEGIKKGNSVPLDEVPEIDISVHARNDVLNKLLEAVRPIPATKYWDATKRTTMRTTASRGGANDREMF